MNGRHTPSLLLLAAMACGAGTTEPTGPPGVRFDDPRGLLTSYRAVIDSLAVATVARVIAVMPIDGVTITVSPDASRAIGGYGLGGYTPDAKNVNLYIDSAFPGLDTLLLQRVPLLLAHELHHAKRWRSPGYGNTLLTAMISEGLADRFAFELLGQSLPPWSIAFPVEQNAHYLELARAEFNATGYSHPRWFFDASATIPRWTGYTLGYRLVEAYIATHPGTNATQLASTPANLFLP